MHLLLSRVGTHVFLAAGTALGVLLVVEWLLPGAVTAAIPLYPMTACTCMALLASASALREAPFWKQMVGTLIGCVPPIALVAAFALNEGQRVFLLYACLTLALLGAMIVGAVAKTDEPLR